MTVTGTRRGSFYPIYACHRFLAAVAQVERIREQLGASTRLRTAPAESGDADQSLKCNNVPEDAKRHVRIYVTFHSEDAAFQHPEPHPNFLN